MAKELDFGIRKVAAQRTVPLTSSMLELDAWKRAISGTTLTLAGRRRSCRRPASYGSLGLGGYRQDVDERKPSQSGPRTLTD
jgi:hypothetical protein